MKDVHKIRRSLFNYLAAERIQFLSIVSEGMEDKAVAKFTFDQRTSPCILSGPFKDKEKEIISIAHEAGHVLRYNQMNKEETLTYLCTMFVANGIGLNNISQAGQECILSVEAGASIDGFLILKKIGVNYNDLEIVTKLLAGWYATYEACCKKNAVQKIRKEIIKKDAVFLLLE
jgi:hypothetical protein